MKRLFLVVTIIFVILVGIFQHSRNSDSDINYERFNLVTPGVLRTPDERFNDIKDYPFSACLLYTSPSPRDVEESRMPSSA